MGLKLLDQVTPLSSLIAYPSNTCVLVGFTLGQREDNSGSEESRRSPQDSAPVVNFPKLSSPEIFDSHQGLLSLVPLISDVH